MLFYKKVFYFLLLPILLPFTIDIRAINAELKAEVQQKIKEGIPEWMKNQISKNLMHVPKSGITKKMIGQTLNQDQMCLILFKIKDGKIEREFNKETLLQAQIDASQPILNALNELNGYVSLPDVEFVYSIDDAPFCWPSILQYKQRPTTRYLVPVFGPCKHINDINVMLIPDCQTLKAIHENIYEDISEGNSKYPWHKKKNKAIWRGATTGGFYRMWNLEQFPRIKLAKLSIDFPDILDAKFNRIWELDETTHHKLIELNYLGDSLPIKDHMEYKYQILIDGNSASWVRSFWQFQCNSVVLKQNSNYITWLDDLFKPWIHYIPFAYNCEDLIDTIKWLRQNDDLLEKVVANANEIAKHSLQYSDILVYFYATIIAYAKLQAQYD